MNNRFGAIALPSDLSQLPFDHSGEKRTNEHDDYHAQ